LICIVLGNLEIRASDLLKFASEIRGKMQDREKDKALESAWLTMEIANREARIRENREPEGTLCSAIAFWIRARQGNYSVD